MGSEWQFLLPFRGDDQRDQISASHQVELPLIQTLEELDPSIVCPAN